MKTKTIFFIVMALISTSGIRTSFAQVSKTKTLPTVVIRSSSAVNQKVIKAFNGEFKNALRPRWYEINRTYIVKFIMKDQKNTALYNRNGNLVYHITYGSGNSLPKAVADLIDIQYPRSKVTTAIHIDQDRRSIWVANIIDGKNLILTRIEDGQLEEVDRYTNTSVN
jgi:hypothetical protein